MGKQDKPSLAGEVWCMICRQKMWRHIPGYAYCPRCKSTTTRIRLMRKMEQWDVTCITCRKRASGSGISRTCHRCNTSIQVGRRTFPINQIIVSCPNCKRPMAKNGPKADRRRYACTRCHRQLTTGRVQFRIPRLPVIRRARKILRTLNVALGKNQSIMRRKVNAPS